MPSPKKTKPKSTRKSKASKSTRSRVTNPVGFIKSGTGSRKSTSTQLMFFWSLLGLVFIFWLIYRGLFSFPIWFDETLGKALFFGAPVWLYVTITRAQKIVDSLSVAKLQPGLWAGTAFGGIFGFVAILTLLLTGQTQVYQVALFSSFNFWWEFALAVFTGFWETLFFYSFVMTIVMVLYRKWSMSMQVAMTALIFVIFHLPNAMRFFTGSALLVQVALLTLFAVGQAFLFYKRQNAYTLIVSHAIWGMVLLVHVW